MSFQNLSQLSETEIQAVLDACMQEDSTLQIPVNISNIAYRDAVAAIDLWLTNNLYLADSSLPEPSKTELSVYQKAKILLEVINLKRLTPLPIPEETGL